MCISGIDRKPHYSEAGSMPPNSMSWKTTYKLTAHGISVVHKTELECEYALSIPFLDMQVLPLLITFNGKKCSGYIV